MSAISLGKVTVTTAGNPVRVTATSTPCQSISLQALSTNTGKIYVGNIQAMSKTTLVGVLGVIAVPTSNALPSASISQMSPAGLDASSFWLDADNSGEGVVVGLVQG
jgi:hypothetical protein